MQSRGQLEPDEDVLEDGIAFAGVSRYPARVKCALLGWMAWKDATAQAVGGERRPRRPHDRDRTERTAADAAQHAAEVARHADGRRHPASARARTTSSRR